MEYLDSIEFKKKSILHWKRMSIEELETYHLAWREYDYENGRIFSKWGATVRKWIHPVLYYLIKLDRRLSREKLIVLGDLRTKSDRPKIFACTHIGGSDVQRAFETIKTHAWLFIGDPGEVYRDLTGLILYGNGAVCLDTGNKKDRRIAFDRACRLLEEGENLLIYPEGVWNITDNLPVLKLFPGIVRMARKTGAEIVPLAIEQYDDLFYVNIGENYLPDTEHEEIALRDLRDRMASLKWDIFRAHGIRSRSEIPNDHSPAYRQEIMNRCPYVFTEEEVYAAMYREPHEK